ncbi:MAG TPA: FdtA/QdtA family cupin domain-containing protein [Gaiellaceae bacterium]|nr:FdtA/QdtA family cupin domain-containing protein [Gaiellaceae bacterium]
MVSTPAGNRRRLAGRQIRRPTTRNESEVARPTPQTRVADCKVIDLPRIPDRRGSLTVIEGEEHIPFPIRRAYWIYEVPGGEERAGHAYRTLHEFIVALSGSFDVLLDDGHETRTVRLNRSYFGLHVRPGVWRTLTDFSTNAVALVLASSPFSEDDYLRDRDAFLRERGA